MKFPQILLLLTLTCMLYLSCKDPIKNGSEQSKPNVITPSPIKEQSEKSRLKKIHRIQTKKYRDSVLQKRRKLKDLDTLMPQVALLG